MFCLHFLVEHKEQIEKAEEKERVEREKEKKEAEEKAQREQSESGEKAEPEKKETEENADNADKPADIKYDDKIGVLEESSLDQVRLLLTYFYQSDIYLSICFFKNCEI